MPANILQLVVNHHVVTAALDITVLEVVLEKHAALVHTQLQRLLLTLVLVAHAKKDSIVKGHHTGWLVTLVIIQLMVKILVLCVNLGTIAQEHQI